MFKKITSSISSLSFLLAFLGSAAFIPQLASAQLLPNGSGTITGAPNPCTIVSTDITCTSLITWNTTNGISASQIWVSDNGAPEGLFAQSLSGGGSQTAPWIQGTGHNYKFSLYDYSSGGRGGTLASVSVTGITPTTGGTSSGGTTTTGGTSGGTTTTVNPGTCTTNSSTYVAPTNVATWVPGAPGFPPFQVGSNDNYLGREVQNALGSPAQFLYNPADTSGLAWGGQSGIIPAFIALAQDRCRLYPSICTDPGMDATSIGTKYGNILINGLKQICAAPFTNPDLPGSIWDNWGKVANPSPVSNYCYQNTNSQTVCQNVGGGTTTTGGTTGNTGSTGGTTGGTTTSGGTSTGSTGGSTSAGAAVTAAYQAIYTPTQGVAQNAINNFLQAVNGGTSITTTSSASTNTTQTSSMNAATVATIQAQITVLLAQIQQLQAQLNALKAAGQI